MNQSFTLILCGTCALASLPLCAADANEKAAKAPFTLTTKAGKVYEKVRVVSADPDGLRIIHADGAAKIPFSEVSEELQLENGFDPAKAAAYKVEQEKIASEALANEVRLQRIQMAEDEAALFRSLHLSILTSVQNMNYDYGKLDSMILAAIERYREADKKDWVKVLEEDRDTLKQREVQRPAIEAARKTKEMEAQNTKLQAQIDKLRSQQEAAEQQRRVTYYADPFTTTYIYQPSPPVYVQPQPIVIRPPVCPTPIRPVPHQDNSGGGYVPQNLRGGLDSHGGYTPPGLR